MAVGRRIENRKYSIIRPIFTKFCLSTYKNCYFEFLRNIAKNAVLKTENKCSVLGKRNYSGINNWSGIKTANIKYKKLTSFIKHVRLMTRIKPQSFAGVMGLRYNKNVFLYLIIDYNWTGSLAQPKCYPENLS